MSRGVTRVQGLREQILKEGIIKGMESSAQGWGMTSSGSPLSERGANDRVKVEG